MVTCVKAHFSCKENSKNGYVTNKLSLLNIQMKTSQREELNVMRHGIATQETILQHGLSVVISHTTFTQG